MYNSFEALRNDCLICQKCELSKERSNVVFGCGYEKSEVMFIGEAPGEQEDLRAEPFVGRSGKLLDSYLNEVGLDRKKNIYITNITKCRPPKNRDPLQSEQEKCIFWLREQIRLMRPKIIVCLGRIAAMKLISPSFKVTQDHGKFFDKNGALMMGTFHPAALLRDPRRKQEAMEDFLRLKEELER